MAMTVAKSQLTPGALPGTGVAWPPFFFSTSNALTILWGNSASGCFVEHVKAFG
jgi:hypothetical protein